MVFSKPQRSYRAPGAVGFRVSGKCWDLKSRMLERWWKFRIQGCCTLSDAGLAECEAVYVEGSW